MLPEADIKTNNPTADSPLEITIPINFKMRGGRKYITTLDGQDLSSARKPKFETNIIKAVACGHHYQDMLNKEPDWSIKILAQKEKMDHGYVAKAVRMTQLAPDIIEAILNGRQPHSLSLTDLMKPFPNNWADQRQHFGF